MKSWLLGPIAAFAVWLSGKVLDEVLWPHLRDQLTYSTLIGVVTSQPGLLLLSSIAGATICLLVHRFVARNRAVTTRSLAISAAIGAIWGADLAVIPLVSSRAEGFADLTNATQKILIILGVANSTICAHLFGRRLGEEAFMERMHGDLDRIDKKLDELR